MPRPPANRSSVYRPPPSSPPVIQHHTAPAATPTLGQSIKDGFGLGIGSAIGQRIVSGIFGAPTVAVTAAPAPREPTAFEKCVAEKRLAHDDIALCAHLADAGAKK